MIATAQYLNSTGSTRDSTGTPREVQCQFDRRRPWEGQFMTAENLGGLLQVPSSTALCRWQWCSMSSTVFYGKILFLQPCARPCAGWSCALSANLARLARPAFFTLRAHSARGHCARPLASQSTPGVFLVYCSCGLTLLLGCFCYVESMGGSAG